MKCGECGSKRFTVKSDDLVCNCCNMIITRIKQEQKQNLISNSKSVKEASKEVI